MIIKSDRVNALRKRYDAFLEEDKKRKERNEYILGCLDKMRYTAASATQLRPKTIFGEYYTPAYNRIEYRPEKLKVQEDIPSLIRQNHQVLQPNENNLQLNVPMPRNFSEDAKILNEISKKYILIPKLSGMYPNEHLLTIPPDSKSMISPLPLSEASRLAPSPNPISNIENNDWKSKYDILEQLRQKEREENNEQKASLLSEPIFEAPTKDKCEVDNNFKFDNVTPKYEHEVPEKDLPIDELREELPPVQNLNLSESQEADHIWNDPAHIAEVAQEQAVPEYTMQGEAQPSTEYLMPETENAQATSEYAMDGTEQEQIPAEYVTQEGELQQDAVETQNEQYEQHYPQEYNPETVQSEYNAEYVDNSEYQNVAQPEYQEYQENQVYAQENQVYAQPGQDVYAPPQDVYAQDGTVYEQQNVPQAMNASGYVQDGLNEAMYAQQTGQTEGENVNQEQTPNVTESGQTNPLGQEVPQPTMKPPGYEPTDTEVGIEEFEAEQREMFYSEDGQGNTGQTDLGEAYNSEFSRPVDYPQMADYSYTQGLEQEQGFPAEVNEYEETTEQYDQSYAQQYTADAAEYETQPQYEQQAEYEQTTEYTPYEEYSYEQQNVETVEQVESALDNEQGYQEQVVENQTEAAK